MSDIIDEKTATKIVRETLSQNYLAINKTLIRNLGLSTAGYFSHLIDCENIYGNGFYQGRNTIGKYLGLSAHEQRKYEKILVSKGLLIIKREGLPYKNHYYIQNSQTLITKNIKELGI